MPVDERIADIAPRFPFTPNLGVLGSGSGDLQGIIQNFLIQASGDATPELAALAGCSEYADDLETALVPPTVTSVIGGDGSVAIGYTEQAFVGVSIEVATIDADTGLLVGLTGITADAASPVTISGLTNGGEYQFYLRTVTAGGRRSRWSEVVTAIPAQGSGSGGPQ